jgi:hypothetical protein
MKRLITSAFAAIALLAAAMTILRSHTPAAGRAAGPPGTTSLQELQSTLDVSKLPTEDFEDQSLVYPRAKQ